MQQNGTHATAKTRKRCPQCNTMIEIGEPVDITDDRYVDGKAQWFGRSFARGAFHLWHPRCMEDRQQQLRAAEIQTEASRAAMFAELEQLRIELGGWAS